ncbi:MAG: hypothetical protein F4103_11900 [Boseongicola sp. SB0673_bin_14]|nr:hypothetical protein [Boseongicola sp. SB0673_bin_14]
MLRDAWRVSSETDTDQLGARPYCEPCSMAGIVSAPWAVVDMPFDDGTTEPAMRASYCEECLNQLCTDAAELAREQAELTELIPGGALCDRCPPYAEAYATYRAPGGVVLCNHCAEDRGRVNGRT